MVKMFFILFGVLAFCQAGTPTVRFQSLGMRTGRMGRI